MGPQVSTPGSLAPHLRVSPAAAPSASNICASRASANADSCVLLSAGPRCPLPVPAGDALSQAGPRGLYCLQEPLSRHRHGPGGRNQPLPCPVWPPHLLARSPHRDTCILGASPCSVSGSPTEPGCAESVAPSVRPQTRCGCPGSLPETGGREHQDLEFSGDWRHGGCDIMFQVTQPGHLSGSYNRTLRRETVGTAPHHRSW